LISALIDTAQTRNLVKLYRISLHFVLLFDAVNSTRIETLEKKIEKRYSRV